MVRPSYTKLKGVTNILRDLETQNLLHGVVDYFRYAFLEVGAFQNITTSVSGIYGGNRSYLRPAKDPRFNDYQVWEGFRGDWVWESGLDYATQPIAISGVTVNSVFCPTSGTAYPHYIDYTNGRVIFNSAIAKTNTVQAEFSHRTVSIVNAEHPYIRHLMSDSYRVDKSDFSASDSGSWNYLGDQRLQLPCVGIKVVPYGDFAPYQIGGGQWGRLLGRFYIFSDNSFERDQIADAIARQNDKTIWIVNRGLIKESGIYPYDLDYRGALVSSPVQYPDIVTNESFQWRKVAFSNTRKETVEMYNDWLYHTIVTTTFEIVLSEI